MLQSRTTWNVKPMMEASQTVQKLMDTLPRGGNREVPSPPKRLVPHALPFRPGAGATHLRRGGGGVG